MTHQLMLAILLGVCVLFASVAFGVYAAIEWRITQEDKHLFQELAQWLVTETQPYFGAKGMRSVLTQPSLQSSETQDFQVLLTKELQAFHFHHYLVRIHLKPRSASGKSQRFVIYRTSGFPATLPLNDMPTLKVASDGTLNFPSQYWQQPTPTGAKRPVTTWLIGRFYVQGVGYELMYNTSNHEAFMRVLGETLGLLVCAGLLLMAWLIHRIIRQGLSPLYAFSERIAEVHHPSDFLTQPQPEWPKEIAPLAAAFRRMMIRLNTHLETLTHFSSHLAHELKTPLASLRLNTEVVLSQKRASEEYALCLEYHLDEYERLSTLVERLLLLAQMDGHQNVLVCQSFPFETLVSRLMDYYHLMADEQSVILAYEVPEDLMIYGDETWLAMVVSNLLSNALKYNRAGGHVHLKAYAKEGGVMLEVIDTGVGVPQEDIPHVFERFYRVDKAHTQRIKGTGLGLALVAAIVEKHHGTIHLESTLHKGTEVFVFFPAKPTEPMDKARV